MSRRALAFSLIACSAIPCRAAELGAECARWAPIADHGAPAVADERTSEEGPSQWWTQAIVIEQPRLRLDGLRIVVHDQPGLPDAQVAAGYQRDDVSGPNGFDGFWLRPYARFGTDSLASRSDAAYGGVGLCAASIPFAGFAAEIGESSERRLVASGELHLMMFHLAGEHDERSDTARVGFAVRVPGSVNAWSWSCALDWATTHLSYQPPTAPNRETSGFLGELTVAWSPWNHVLIAGQAALATNAMRDDGWQGTLATAALALGVGW